MYACRDYQEAAIDSIFDYFGSGNRGNPIVAMPTGTGKSIVIAQFIRRVFGWWPSQRVMMLTHVKKLIEQNAEKLQEVWPTAPLGIYSAGLSSRESNMPIIFGGVQSVAKHIQRSLKEENVPDHLKHFGFRDLLLIDECHLLSPAEDTQYQYVIAELQKINPNLKVIGFTATPYRMKQGMITDGGLFTDICYDITDFESFNRLVAEGYLCPLIPKKTSFEVDVSNVGVTAGEYNSKQLEAATDKDEIIFNAVKETIQYGHDRCQWLIFTAGISSAEHVAAAFQSMGVSAACVHSKLPDKENDKRIRDYKAGNLRCIVNKDMLTTGFDHPPIDLIGNLRTSTSPGLWVQMLGRETRPSPQTGKVNGLVLDFTKNTRTLGPINDPKIPRKPGKGGGEVPVKLCEACGVYNHPTARECMNCGAPFLFKNKLFNTASTAEVMRGDLPIVEYFNVTKVLYNLHEKKNSEGILISPPSIKVSYFCGLQMFNEWVCLEHPGFVAKRARDWWRQRHTEDAPLTTYEALRKTSQLRAPARIRVHVNKKHPEILGAEW